MPKISNTTVRRLPEYLRILKQQKDKKEQYISSSFIAQELNLDPILVRKDLASTGVEGRPKLGFLVNELIDSIKVAVGLDKELNAIVIGVGHLGNALFNYTGFAKFNLNIIAGFDKFKQEKTINGKKLLHISQLENYLLNHEVDIAILTVPIESAQEIADIVVSFNINAIWNFSPVNINVPKNVIIKKHDMVESLAGLTTQMKQK